MTPKQRELYDFINDYWQHYGFAPTFHAMAIGIGVTSKSQVHRLVNQMVERRLVEYSPGLRRTIRTRPLGSDEFQRGYSVGFEDGRNSRQIDPVVLNEQNIAHNLG